jgi:hypothetical protein
MYENPHTKYILRRFLVQNSHNSALFQEGRFFQNVASRSHRSTLTLSQSSLLKVEFSLMAFRNTKRFLPTPCPKIV